jgi:hypothetical protein
MNHQRPSFSRHRFGGDTSQNLDVMEETFQMEDLPRCGGQHDQHTQDAVHHDLVTDAVCFQNGTTIMQSQRTLQEIPNSRDVTVQFTKTLFAVTCGMHFTKDFVGFQLDLVQFRLRIRKSSNKLTNNRKIEDTRTSTGSKSFFLAISFGLPTDWPFSNVKETRRTSPPGTAQQQC